MNNNFHPTFIDLTTLQSNLQCSHDEALDLLAQSLEDIQHQQLPEVVQAWGNMKQANGSDECKTTLHQLERLVHRLKGSTCMGHLPILNTTATLLNQQLKQCEGRLPHEQALLARLYQQLLDDVQKTVQAAKPHLSPQLHSLEQFLHSWDQHYQQQITPLALFDGEQVKQWTTQQRHQFVYYFYHARGHFSQFLWKLGNEAPTASMKQTILTNFSEEFGNHAKSHEQLYYDFAQAVGVNDIEKEAQQGHYYCEPLKQFNQGHLDWLNRHDWSMKWATFAAYERLDNIDYIQLLALAKALGASGQGLTFFMVHQQANHFDQTFYDLIDIWEAQPDTVKQGFAFIQQHQLAMWQWLSQTLCQA